MRTGRGAAAFLGLDFVSPTHSLTSDAIFTSPPSIENHELWVQHSCNAAWVWGAKPVLKGALGPRSDQPFLDLVAFPDLSYHWISRKRIDVGVPDPARDLLAATSNTAVRKRCDKFDGSFCVTLFSGKHNLEHGEPAADSKGPLLQIDFSNGVRFAGRPISGSWLAFNHFSWKNIDATICDPRWCSGDLVLNPDYNSGEAIVHGATKSPLRWRITRARLVAGPGGLKLFSLKRTVPAPPGAMRLAPMPPNNREDYNLPLAPFKIQGPRRMVTSWDIIVRAGPLARVRRAIKRENHYAKACLSHALTHDEEVLSEESYRKIRAVHRPPPTVTLHPDDYFPNFQGTMWLRREDGRIWEMFDSDGPILPGKAKPEGFRSDNRDSTPWANQSLFDNLDRGWPTPGVYPDNHSVVFRPYSTTLYRDIKRWVSDVREGSGPDALIRLFTWSVPDDLISIPYVAAARFSIPKPGRVNEFRQIVNLGATLERWLSPTAPPKIPNVPHFADPLNDRIRDAAASLVNKHKLEMTKGADVGHGLAIYHDWLIDMEMLTFDAKSFFHCFAVYFRRAMEQGVITLQGLALSNTKDMGGTDCPANTGEASSFITESTSLQLHQVLVACDKIKEDDDIQAMLAARSRVFGFNNRNSRVALLMMYSDDLVVLVPKGCRAFVEYVVALKGELFGMTWTSEKYGLNTHIGFHYNLRVPLRDSTQHIKPDKLAAYAEQADSIASHMVADHEEVDSFLGRCNFASGIILRIKQRMGALSRCRYMPNRLQEGRFPLSTEASSDTAAIGALLRENKGLPLMCDTSRPFHGDITTVTHRSDACLNESGQNGFGVYWVVPNPNGGVKIFALLDTWSTEEEALFDRGGGVPAAEACAALLGVRAVRQHNVMQPHHRDLLQLSDSSTTAVKFASLKLGAPVMDSIRDHWLAECELLSPWRVSLEHTFREYNVGSDLLSKQEFQLFVDTIVAAGLPAPIRIELSPANRDLSAVLSCL